MTVYFHNGDSYAAIIRDVVRLDIESNRIGLERGCYQLSKVAVRPAGARTWQLSVDLDGGLLPNSVPRRRATHFTIVNE